MTRVRLSDTVEDYLKAVYKLTSEGDRAGTGQIAELLGLSPASVTDMLQRLAGEDPPLLDYVKHRGASLTDDGQRVALEVIRHHRLLELFLHEVLGYSWDQVHEEADRLEHVISEDFEERVAEVLGDPQRGLHGEPIPSRGLKMPEVETRYLSDLSPGQQGTIHSVSDDNAGFLRYLGKQGLIPGVDFLVLDYSPYDHTMHLQIHGREEKSFLGVSATSQILVQVEANT